MKFQPFKIILSLLIVATGLSACGQRGPLYHPEKPAPLSTKQDESRKSEANNR